MTFSIQLFTTLFIPTITRVLCFFVSFFVLGRFIVEVFFFFFLLCVRVYECTTPFYRMFR